MLSDKDIVSGIASNKSNVLNYVYKEYFPYVDIYVRHHGGNTDKAKDIFQEGMIIVFRKITAGKFSLDCKFSTYLYAVCKRVWIQEKKKEAIRFNKMQEMSLAHEPNELYGHDTIEKAKELLDKHFLKISPECQKVLQLHFNGVTVEEIRKVMGLNAIHNAADKKYRCKKNLIERIIKDPLFSKLKK